MFLFEIRKDKFSFIKFPHFFKLFLFPNSLTNKLFFKFWLRLLTIPWLRLNSTMIKRSKHAHARWPLLPTLALELQWVSSWSGCARVWRCAGAAKRKGGSHQTKVSCLTLYEGRKFFQHWEVILLWTILSAKTIEKPWVSQSKFRQNIGKPQPSITDSLFENNRLEPRTGGDCPTINLSEKLNGFIFYKLFTQRAYTWPYRANQVDLYCFDCDIIVCRA